MAEREFSFAVTENVNYNAVWDIGDLKNFDFTVTEYTCTITGLKDNNATSVIIPDCVTSIGEKTFYNCTSLTRITIPDSVTRIGDSAFSDSPIEYASAPAFAFRYISKSKLKTAIITSGDSIGYSAFYNCASLKSVTIPDSVTSIGKEAFENCPIEYASAPAFAFGYIDKNNLKTAIITSGDSIDYCAFSDCSSLTSVTIGNGVTTIDYCAFSRCSSLTSITISDSVTSIDMYAFSGCTSLTRVTIPDSVTSIGIRAFYNCTSLTSVTIGNGVTWIGKEAFRGCISLTSITIPDSVTSIDEWAFTRCDNIQTVFYKGGKEQWDKIKIGEENANLINKLYFYSEAKPTNGGKYWHYAADGVTPVIW